MKIKCICLISILLLFISINVFPQEDITDLPGISEIEDVEDLPVEPDEFSVIRVDIDELKPQRGKEVVFFPSFFLSGIAGFFVVQSKNMTCIFTINQI